MGITRILAVLLGNIGQRGSHLPNWHYRITSSNAIKPRWMINKSLAVTMVKEILKSIDKWIFSDYFSKAVFLSVAADPVFKICFRALEKSGSILPCRHYKIIQLNAIKLMWTIDRNLVVTMVKEILKSIDKWIFGDYFSKAVFLSVAADPVFKICFRALEKSGSILPCWHYKIIQLNAIKLMWTIDRNLVVTMVKEILKSIDKWIFGDYFSKAVFLSVAADPVFKICFRALEKSGSILPCWHYKIIQLNAIKLMWTIDRNLVVTMVKEILKSIDKWIFSDYFSKAVFLSVAADPVSKICFRALGK